MSEITNAEINKKAAEIAGHSFYSDELSGSGILCAVVGNEAGDIDTYCFDIYQSAACREAVVIALGEKHDIGIAYMDFGGISCGSLITGWSWAKDNCDSGPFETGFATYIEALSAAVQAVK